MGESKIKGLLRWCQRLTDGYHDVHVTDMTSSWRNGLAFCAIVHRFRPDLIDYDSLSKENVFENNNLAFKKAEGIGIPALLEAADMVALRVPDRLSIITYVAQMHNYFKDKPQLGKPSVSTKLDGNTQTGVKRHQDKVLSPVSEPKRFSLAKHGKDKEILPQERGTPVGDRCRICSERVYLIERYMEDGRLFHRSCYRKNNSPVSSSHQLQQPVLQEDNRSDENNTGQDKTRKKFPNEVAVGGNQSEEKQFGKSDSETGKKAVRTDEPVPEISEKDTVLKKRESAWKPSDFNSRISNKLEKLTSSGEIKPHSSVVLQGIQCFGGDKPLASKKNVFLQKSKAESSADAGNLITATKSKFSSGNDLLGKDDDFHKPQSARIKTLRELEFNDKNARFSESTRFNGNLDASESQCFGASGRIHVSSVDTSRKASPHPVVKKNVVLKQPESVRQGTTPAETKSKNKYSHNVGSAHDPALMAASKSVNCEQDDHIVADLLTNLAQIRRKQSGSDSTQSSCITSPTDSTGNLSSSGSPLSPESRPEKKQREKKLLTSIQERIEQYSKAAPEVKKIPKVKEEMHISSNKPAVVQQNVIVAGSQSGKRSDKQVATKSWTVNKAQVSLMSSSKVDISGGAINFILTSHNKIEAADTGKKPGFNSQVEVERANSSRRTEVTGNVQLNEKKGKKESFPKVLPIQEKYESSLKNKVQADDAKPQKQLRGDSKGKENPIPKPRRQKMDMPKSESNKELHKVNRKTPMPTKVTDESSKSSDGLAGSQGVRKVPEKPEWQVEAQRRMVARKDGYADPEKGCARNQIGDGVKKTIPARPSFSPKAQRTDTSDRQKANMVKNDKLITAPMVSEKKVIQLTKHWDFDASTDLESSFSSDAKSPSSTNISDQNMTNTKRTAPERPPPLKISARKKSMTAEDLKRELLEIDSKLTDLELRGRRLEDLIRTGNISDDKLLIEWFQVINEKNELVRKENDLVQVSHSQRLEEKQACIDHELRMIMGKPKQKKSKSEREREKRLLDQLLEMVNQRSLIVDSMEENRIRYNEEDKLIEQVLKEKGMVIKESGGLLAFPGGAAP